MMSAALTSQTSTTLRRRTDRPFDKTSKSCQAQHWRPPHQLWGICTYQACTGTARLLPELPSSQYASATEHPGKYQVGSRSGRAPCSPTRRRLVAGTLARQPGQWAAHHLTRLGRRPSTTLPSWRRGQAPHLGSLAAGLWAPGSSLWRLLVSPGSIGSCLHCLGACCEERGCHCDMIPPRELFQTRTASDTTANPAC